MQAKDHNIILGFAFLIEFIISGGIMLVIFLLYGINIVMTVINSSDIQNVLTVLVGFLIVVVIFLIFQAPLGIASWKLLKQKRNARTWGIISSIISLPFMLPIGLAICIYGLWFFLSNEGKNFYLNK